MRTTRLILLAPFALLPIDSVFAATIVVNDMGDALHSPGCATTGAGTCTLRDAITFANANAGPDVINFNISGAGVHTIQPTSNLPAITGPLTIDGYSQPGSSVNTLPVGDNALLLIELDGSLAGLANGLTVYTDNCTIKGLAINRFGNPGIAIDVTGGGAVGGHVIQGNFIGTDPTGTIARGNTGFGIYVRSPNNTIGGPNPADRNVISANQLAGSPGLSSNIKFEADFGVNTTGNVVQGNYVGTDASGTVALASANSGHGIIVQNGLSGGGGGVTIGATSAGTRNVISGNPLFGVQIASIPCGPTTPTTGVVIYGNFIGTNAAGTGAVGNGSGGISLGCGASNTSVGATSAGAGNVISGNSSVASSAPGIGVSSTASGNVIQGNLIGTNPSGTAALPNFLGVDLEGAVGVTVGGTSAAARNVISGNSNTGVRISSGSSHTVQGNFIGTDATGASPLGNNNQGLRIDNSTGNAVGGSAAGAGNVISANSDVAVRITTASNNTIQKNVIGLNAAGSALLGNLGGGVYVFSGTGNRITANSIDGNTNLGIDLGGDGVTPNDPCDPDAGSNNLQNYPVLTSVSSGGGSTTIQGTLNSTANTSFTVEFFSSPACDPSGFGEGRVYLGSAVVATDGTCSATFNTTLPVAINTGDRVTATATDPAGNTSEFSACSPTPGRYFTVAPCRVADTRNPIGPYGGPALAANADRTFVIATQCGIPSSATAVAFNFTVTQPIALGDLRVVPAGVGLPLVSVMNWRPGQTRANNAVVSLGPAGDIVAHVDQASGTVHFIIDVNGYFQ